ncbi:MAG: ComF family protein [Muribaculaceae bacterium]|nr:ComF family protein [Muribaculaceae bacterium]
MKTDRLLHAAKLWSSSLVSMFIPDTCTVCGRTLVEGEEIMCLGCLHGLPRTYGTPPGQNEILDRLISLRAPVERATSLFQYHKENPYSRLILDCKYHARPVIGRRLAAMHAREMTGIGFFDGIDCVVPVPIHFFKRMKRGYNQTHGIAHGISDVTGIPVAYNLRAARYHTSQTRRNSRERQRNAIGSFYVNRPSELDGMHILIVDDVITTGATLHEAAETIRRANQTVRLSVFSLALTYNT